MKKNKKILTLIVAGALGISTLVGCSNSGIKNTSKTFEPFFAASEDNPLKDLEYVVKIDDYKVSPDEYRYVYENSKAKYAYYAGEEDIFTGNEELMTQIKDDALAMLQYNVAARTMALEHKIEFTEEDAQKVEGEINETSNQLGKSAFEKALKESFLTPELYTYVVKQGVQKEKLYSELFSGDGKYAVSDAELMEASKDYIRAKHVLINVENEDWAAAEAKANEVYEKAVAGEDFDTLIKDFGQDPGMAQSPDGYYFKEGQMVENFYLSAKALENNEISKPVKTEYGYHVILRLPVEDKYVKENSDLFVSEKQFDNFYSMLEDYKLKQKVEFCEGYDAITIDTFTKETK